MNGKTIKHLVMAAAMLACNARGEANPYDGYEVDFGNSSSEKNDIADGMFNEMRADENAVRYNAQNDSRGREYKAQDSANQAGLGMATAIATGSALIARGTPMTSSPFLATRIAGYNLLAKGALEFAQAGASGAAMGQNRDQQKLLESQADAAQNQASFDRAAFEREVAQKAGSAELNNILGQNGVNSDAFMHQLASGQLTTPEAIARAMGDTTEYSAEDWARGLAMDLPTDKARLLSDETNDQRAASDDKTAPAGGGAAGANVAAGTAAGGAGGETARGAVATDSSGPAAGKSRGSAKATAGEEAGGSGLAVDMASLMGGLFGQGAAALKNGLHALDRATLEKLGVTRAVKGQNIFNMAHRTFRAFGKWRVPSRRVASAR